MKDIDVLVIGRSCVDYLAVVPYYPREDQKVHFKQRLVEAGGQGSTASCCIKMLGGNVVYVGRIGDDEEGRFCLKRLQDFNVRTNFVNVIKGGKTPVAYIFITETSGKRTIIYEPYSLPAIEIDNEIKGLVKRANVMFLDPEVTYLARELREIDENVKIVYDCERWKDGITDMMEIADYFIPSSIFLKSANEVFKEDELVSNIHILNDMTKGELIVTDGENGAYLAENNKIYNICPPGVRVKDTIGAGDNFHGAFAFAVSQGDTLHESAKIAVAAASLSCREWGGRKGLPTLSEAKNAAKGLDIKEI